MSAAPTPRLETILAVDDQSENLELIEEILAPENYRVLKAADGEAALRAVETESPDCILLDVMMPRLDGFTVCRRLKERRRTCFIPVIILTALSEVSDKVHGLEAGADDFLNKPVNALELLARVRALLRIKRLRDDLDTSENLIFSMVKALEMKDPINAGHSERVALRAIRLARHLDLPDDQVEVIAKGAMLHDLGKIGIPESILWPRVEEPENRSELRRHAEIGAQILAPLASMEAVRELVLRHHERLDGSGYPGGLVGGAFTLPMEIVALSNHFDALAYQLPSVEDARENLRREADEGKFHPEVVAAFLDEAVQSPAEEGFQAMRWESLLPVPVGVAPKGKILIGDDTSSSREVIEEILSSEGHQVACVGTGDAVLTAVERVEPDLVLVDIRMPGMDGFSVCDRIKMNERDSILPVILVTAYREMKDRMRGTLVGADDFLLLPLNRHELNARVKSLLRLKFYVRDLEQHQDVLLALASALEAKDPYTHGHSRRVGELSRRLALALGFPEEEAALLDMAGRLHDIGKIGMPERLLNKPGRLSALELHAVQSHPVQGELICRHLQTAKAVLPVIRHHHERFDGSGYPDRLEGESIPLGARILGLTDAYDAMISSRSYRGPLSSEQAMVCLREETKSGRWDPAVFSAFETMMEGR